MTASKTSGVSGWSAVKSAATWFSKVTWSGSWPVPRQQYQRMPPGGTDGGTYGAWAVTPMTARPVSLRGRLAALGSVDWMLTTRASAGAEGAA